MSQILAYLLCIVLADVIAARWIVSIGFGLMVPAGVFMIAPIFTLRDSLHRKYGAKWVTAFIFIASAISYILSVVTSNELLGKVTIASVVAFLISENLDTIVYHLVRERSWMYRVMTSNSVSAAVDSIVFIWIAFGFSLNFMLGQYIVKMILAGLVGILLARTRS